MKRIACFLAFALTCGLLLMCGMAVAADQPANVAGTWEVSSQGRNGQPMTQTLTIQQDGGKITGTLTSPRGDANFEGMVTGNKVAFTIKRETDNGTFVMEYSATVDGDAMKGTLHTERFDREWTAKRTK